MQKVRNIFIIAALLSGAGIIILKKVLAGIPSNSSLASILNPIGFILVVTLFSSVVLWLRYR